MSAVACVCATALSLLAAPAAAEGAGKLYVYGHSLTTGAGVTDPAQAYPRLVAAEGGWADVVLRGVNGSLVHQASERLYGTGPDSWSTATPGDVLIHANLNTARDFGPDPLALVTSRNALRAMVATVGASRRIESSSRSHAYAGRWRARRMPWASGGSVHVATRNDAHVQFRAVGGEYVAIRGVSGTGVTLRVSDRTARRTIGRIKTGRRVHPAYSHSGVPVLYRLPDSTAGHTIRMTKESGTGSFVFDARLPGRSDPGTVILVKEPYLADYSLSTAHPHGSDAAIDAFNGVLDTLATEFPFAVTVDLNAAGWDPTTLLQPDGVHPTDPGHRFIADAVLARFRRTPSP